jgi:membrane protein required for colicin V production
VYGPRRMIFDAAIYLLAALAVIMGFNSGFLRSLATILGYVAAAPVALVAAPTLSQFLAQNFQMPPTFNGVVLFGALIVTGMALSALLRRTLHSLVGPNISLPDRIAGSALGAVRIGLLAVLLVVIFDRIIPAGREPNFLKESQLRPYLLTAGRAGLKALPPDVLAYIDRLKRERGL